MLDYRTLSLLDNINSNCQSGGYKVFLIKDLVNGMPSAFNVDEQMTEGECVGAVEVAGGESNSVELLAAADFSYPLSREEKVTRILSGPGFAYAPVVQGEEAGFVYLCIGDKAVGKVPVVYGQTVERSKEKVKKHFWDSWFGG